MTQEANPKDKVRFNAVNAWWPIGVGIISACPGAGKTRIGLEIADLIRQQYLKLGLPFTCLLVSFSTISRDTNFPKELKKWGFTELAEIAENYCIQSIYKQEKKHWTVVVVDEVHNMVGEEHIEFFRNNTFTYRVGLSGTVKPEVEKLLKSIKFPIVYKLTLAQGVALGVVNEFKIINYRIELSANRYKEYDAIVTQYKTAMRNMGANSYNCNDKAKEITANKYHPLIKYAYAFNRLQAARSKFIGEAVEKIEIGLYIRKLFPNRKTIIFAHNIEQCEMIGNKIDAVTVHSKKTKKKNDAAFIAFENNIVNTLVAVKKVNEVYDLQNVSLGIVISGLSSSVASTQRTGRSTRFQEDGEISYVFNIVLKGTIEEEAWLGIRNSTYDENVIVDVYSKEELNEFITKYRNENQLRLE